MNFIIFSFQIIENDTYASIHKATTYDNEPLPPQRPTTTREDSLILSPSTPYNNKRRSSYDVNTPLPWESNNEITKQPTKTQSITHESKRNSLNNNTQNQFDDDYLFSPTSAPIKPKPRLSLQTKTEDHYQSENISDTIINEHESTIPMNFNSTIPMNFNSTIRKPATTLHNVDWLTDSQPATTTIEKTPLHNVEEEEQRQRSPSPQINNHSDLNPYGNNDFDDTDNSEQ
jgi:hypothetical protein